MLAKLEITNQESKMIAALYFDKETGDLVDDSLLNIAFIPEDETAGQIVTSMSYTNQAGVVQSALYFRANGELHPDSWITPFSCSDDL